MLRPAGAKQVGEAVLIAFLTTLAKEAVEHAFKAWEERRKKRQEVKP